MGKPKDAPPINLKQQAGELARLLRALADAAEKAADGDEEAKAALAEHLAVDGHWAALTVGHGIAALLAAKDPKARLCQCCMAYTPTGPCYRCGHS